MGDTAAKRSMDEFLINPTVPMEAYSGHGKSLSPTINSMPLFALRPGKKTSEVSATISKFENEEIFWRDYASDEEVASPVDDEFTFDSNSSDSESIASIHEAQYHAQTCNNAQQLCNRAQAVQFVSAGKAKVVSMPKLVDVPATSSPQASIHETQARPSVSSISRMRPATANHYVHSSGNRSIISSPRSSGEDSLYSAKVTRTALPTGANFVRRKPNLPRIQTTIGSGTPQSDSSASTPRTAWPMGRVNFLDYDSVSSDHSGRVTSAPSQSKRKPQRLSPPFSLKNLSRSLRRGSTPDGSSGEDSKKEASPPVLSPIIPDMYIPSRTSSRRMPKMVARGASERAAAIEIPPCPADYEDDSMVPVWPPRSDSVANIEPPRRAATMHGRRKSLSALASTQA